MSTGFQRARSAEQREQRRRAILDTAAAMLAEMPVAEVSLNELSRRVGLAKSNVLRYFESREAVLLELLDAATAEWLESLDAVLGAAADPAAGPYERADAVAAALTDSLIARPVLCDLVSAQAAVLERNVSAQVAAQYKRAAVAAAGTLARLVAARLPELGDDDAVRFAAALMLTTGAAWSHAHPSAAMLDAYAADPSLTACRLDLADMLRQMFAVVLSGLLARRPESGVHT